jgi:hypothetical protein
MLSPTRRSRINGCDPPFSVEQIGSVFLELFFTTLTLAVISLYADRPGPLAICLILYLLCFLTVAVSYIYCSSVDPAAPNIDYFLLPTRKSTTSRYCRLCSKSIPGLDHHCIWLNTCIGARNYWAFYVLASAGLLQHILQLILCALVATPLAWKMSSSDRGENGPAFAGIVSSLSVIGIVAFGSLWLFHSYLLTQGIGTYDWLLRRSERRAKREEEEERKEDERIRQELTRASERMHAAAETISKMDSDVLRQQHFEGNSNRQEDSSVVVGMETIIVDDLSNGILGPRPTQIHSRRLSIDSDDDNDFDQTAQETETASTSPRLSSAAEMRRRERVATLRANLTTTTNNNSNAPLDDAFEETEIPSSTYSVLDATHRLFSTKSSRISGLQTSSENKIEEDTSSNMSIMNEEQHAVEISKDLDNNMYEKKQVDDVNAEVFLVPSTETTKDEIVLIENKSNTDMPLSLNEEEEKEDLEIQEEKDVG